MDFESTFPRRLYLNLAKRQDRRVAFEDLLDERGLGAERFPAVNAAYVRNTRGFADAGRYAHSLTTRLALRRAMASGAEALFLFEDDARLRRDFREVLADIELPEDWGMFYLGCQHMERPSFVSKNLVRVARSLDTHAWGCRRRYFRKVLRQLNAEVRGEDGVRVATDIALAQLHREIPTYAAFPNLSWQAAGHSDLARGTYSNYDVTGSQRLGQRFLSGLAAETLAGLPGGKTSPAPGGARGKVAFLFLTIADHSHPEIWEEYWSGHAGEVAVYAHAKDRGALADRSWVRGHLIREQVDTAWGDVGLVRAQLALLRAAFADGSNSWFVFASDTCVPVRPFLDLRRLISLDRRSRFSWLDLDQQVEIDRLKASRFTAAPSIPSLYWRFHSQWISLDRAAAGEILAHDFTCHFADCLAPDESYFGTVLSMRGFDLGERVAPQDLTWARWPGKGGAHPDRIGLATPELAAELHASGRFFARKFAPGSGIGRFGLHRPAGRAGRARHRPADQGHA